MLSGSAKGKKVLVAAGPGGNGGGGLVAARHLHNRGCDVSVLLVAKDESKITDAVRHQLDILQKMNVVTESDSTAQFDNYDAIVDAIYGYSLTGNPREPAASIIRRINESTAPVVSNDIPTGIDATTGEIHEPAIRASATVTIAMPKAAFENEESRKLSGDLYLGDISVPTELYKQSLKLNVPNIFGEGSVVRIAH